MENIEQNRKIKIFKYTFPQFQYKTQRKHIVSFSGFVFQENETKKTNTKENETNKQHQHQDAGAAKLRPRFIPRFLFFTRT